jgi:rubrerythrin
MADQISAEALNYITLGIQAEIAAYVFYKIGSSKITDVKVREAMLLFAGEEKKHFLTLEHHYDQYVRSEKWVTYRDVMSREELPVIDESMGDKHVKRIERVQMASTLQDVLQIALELEKEAFSFYSEAAQMTAVPDIKKTFEYLTNFELGHVRNVEGMIAAARK